MTFAELTIKRMNGLIETANKDSAWEMEAVAEMMKTVHLLNGVAQTAVTSGTLTFGALVENIAASDRNPIKRGIFIRKTSAKMAEYATKEGCHSTPLDNLRAAPSVSSTLPVPLARRSEADAYFKILQTIARFPITDPCNMDAVNMRLIAEGACAVSKDRSDK